MDNINDTAPVWVSALLPACVLCNDTTLLCVIGTINKPCPPGTALVPQCVITANWGKGAELNVYLTPYQTLSLLEENVIKRQ